VPKLAKIVLDFNYLPTPTEQLVADAHEAIAALWNFIDTVMPHVDDGTPLDIADPLVAEVETFVKAYRKRYGSPVR
jgi:hypothetical protein